MIRTGTLLENRYEILGKIGSGGMADVYKAKCRKLGRYVAVKVLKPEYSNDEHFLAKFSAEAQAAARLAHPNIVNVYDVGEEKDLHYIVLELVEGITLKQYIEKKGKLEIRESIGIAMQIAQGMETAHEHKIIHRDIKPQNIMISKDGKVKVTDFGIAKAPSSQTINSATMGSVHYISPEQARGGYCDERSDIYSLGITMYEMLTGHVPYEGDSAVAVALLHIQGEMESPLKYDSMIPVSLEKIIMKCTQKKPEMRYANVSLLIADLRRSLMTPDEDFVKIVPITSSGATRVMSEEEMSQIKEGVSLNPDSDDDTDFFFDEEQDYLMGIEPDISEEDDDQDIEDDDEEEEEEETSKSEKIMFGVFIGVAVLILFLVIYLLLQFFGIIGRKGPVDDPTDGTQQTTEALPDETEAPTSAANKTVKMPDLSDMNEEEIEKALEKMGLIPKFRYQESGEVKEGYIISQENAPGEDIKRGATVSVIISAGTDIVTLPTDLKGKTTDEVRTILANLELESKVEYDYSETIAKGKVVRTSPGEGTVVAKGKVIKVIESLGQKPKVTIPDLSKKTKDEVKELLEDLKLTVTYKEEYSEEIKKNYVISQSITAGSKVDENSELIVVISIGAEAVEMPDLVTGGLTYEEAVKILEELDLKVTDISETYRNDETLGDFEAKVWIQYPLPKVMVNSESTIYLDVIRTVVTEMPQLKGLTENEAAELLKKYGMEVTIIKRPVSYCTEKDLGRVAIATFDDINKTNVPINGPVAVGSKIILTIHSDNFEMPDVINGEDWKNLTYDQVVDKLKKDYQLTVKEGEGVYSSIEKGKLAEQSPKAGEKVSKGDTIIILNKSLGKPKVPSGLAGMTYSQAESALTAIGLKAAKTEEYSSTVAAGVVISADKAAGTELNLGTTVTLTVSKGPEPVTTAKVPSGLAGKTYAEAEAALTAVGLKAAKTEEFSSTVAAGVVISANKAEGTELNLGTTVTLTVSKGPEPVTTAKVPSGLAGMTYSEAEAALTAVGLTAAKTEEYSSTIAEGVVISADKAEGTELNLGTTVTLTVSKGPEPVTTAKVPSGLAGKTYAEAEAALTAVGLTAAKTEEYSDTVDVGVVISADVAEGTDLALGSTVTLSVSKGPMTP